MGVATSAEPPYGYNVCDVAEVPLVLRVEAAATYNARHGKWLGLIGLVMICLLHRLQVRTAAHCVEGLPCHQYR